VAFSSGRLRPTESRLVRLGMHVAQRGGLRAKARQRIFPCGAIGQQLAGQHQVARGMHGGFRRASMAGSVWSARIKSTATVLGEAAEILPALGQRLAQAGHAAIGIQRRLVDGQQDALGCQAGGWYSRNIQS
jgi:hypothetical protein